MRIVRPLFCLLISMGMTWPMVALAQGAGAHWQGVALSAGSSLKSKLEHTEGRALSVVGRARSLSPLLPLKPLNPLDRWWWRPVITAGMLYQRQAAEGVQVLGVGAETGRRLGTIANWFEPYLSFSFGPTLLSDDVLGPLIVGGDLQFTSSVTIGVTMQTPLPVRIAYRLSHTSNGGIRTENPGVDITGLIIEFPVLVP